jgi:hypothetical protein
MAIRFATKDAPESNVADNYVDTGELPADHAWRLGAEALWNEGPFSVARYSYVDRMTGRSTAANSIKLISVSIGGRRTG